MKKQSAFKRWWKRYFKKFPHAEETCELCLRAAFNAGRRSRGKK